MRARTVLLLVLAGLAAACSKSSPTAPTPATWSLSGTVSAAGGGPISLATIAILDGPEAGKQATSDAAGRYAFSGLQQAGFSVRATANGFTPAGTNFRNAVRIAFFQLKVDQSAQPDRLAVGRPGGK